MTQEINQILSSNEPRVALIGLGAMGSAFARRLVSTGRAVTVWNRTKAKTSGLQGVAVADTAADAVRNADIVLLMLSDDNAVLDVVRSMASDVPAGAVLVDLSTVHPETSSELHSLVPLGVHVIDAPVMGSSDAALKGSLGLLVGADESAFELVRPVLSLLGTPSLVGGPGAGSAAKVAVMSAIIPGILAVGEGLAVGRSFGLDEDTLRSVFSHTTIGGLTQRVFAVEADYATRLAAKDLELARRGKATVLVSQSVGLLESAGNGDEDLGRAALRIPA
ncbi:NAD(P)-dependent oxidoreductase [Paenarthrobacter sp. NPDC018779]|uniref:NAD(P)-dependent oxidoreductase n=1 Tax=Paenarthrobacter sp. NPDC018779 TaxID=3364375 RepID=UPI0037CC55D3